jgi:hypothetical protein
MGGKFQNSKSEIRNKFETFQSKTVLSFELNNLLRVSKLELPSPVS